MGSEEIVELFLFGKHVLLPSSNIDPEIRSSWFSAFRMIHSLAILSGSLKRLIF